MTASRLCSLSLLFLLATAPLAGCNDAGQSAQGVAQVQQAVRQQYRAETVDATLHQQDGQARLEVVLANPGGREATNQQSARRVAGTARQAYDGSALDTVRVSFEYSSTAGPAEVGFHRRYSFSPNELEGVTDTTAAAPADTAVATQDTTAAAPDTASAP